MTLLKNVYWLNHLLVSRFDGSLVVVCLFKVNTSQPWVMQGTDSGLSQGVAARVTQTNRCQPGAIFFLHFAHMSQFFLTKALSVPFLSRASGNSQPWAKQALLDFTSVFPWSWHFQHCNWLYLTVPGCTWLYLALRRSVMIYFTTDCHWLAKCQMFTILHRWGGVYQDPQTWLWRGMYNLK